MTFVTRLESAGFDTDKARALAGVIADAQEVGREELVTTNHLDLRLAEFEGRFSTKLAELEGRSNKQLAESESRLNKQLGDLEVRLTRQIGDIGRDLSNRLWSTVAIIAGVSTAISATIGAGIALLLRQGGL